MSHPSVDMCLSAVSEEWTNDDRSPRAATPSLLPSSHPLDHEDRKTAQASYVLQLTAGTDIEETEQGRIVQTNHGPMMLVPLSGTPPPVSVSDNIAGSSTGVPESLMVQWQKTPDGHMVAFPLSQGQVLHQGMLGADPVDVGDASRAGPSTLLQKDGTDGAVDHSSFTGLLSQGRGLVATAGSLTGSLTAGGDDALLLSPRRPRRPGGNDLCFSPVLLSRRGERNLIMGNPLDVQMPEIGSDGLDDHLAHLAGIPDEGHASRTSPDPHTMPLEFFETGDLSQNMKDAPGAQAAPQQSWEPCTTAVADGLPAADITATADSPQRAEKVDQSMRSPAGGIRRGAGLSGEGAARSAAALSARSPAPKRKSSVLRSPPLPPRVTAFTRSRLADIPGAGASRKGG